MKRFQPHHGLSLSGRLPRREHVAGADDARSAAGRECVGECRCGAPAGAVSGRDDSRFDEFLEVADGRFDAVLDGCAGTAMASQSSQMLHKGAQNRRPHRRSEAGL